jgi:hypothetical protein
MASERSVGHVQCVPRYIIDLDLPPQQRWNQVVDDYKGMGTLQFSLNLRHFRFLSLLTFFVL